MPFTFVLIHGHWHGSWCWSGLVPLLEAQGHRVLTPQLPSDRLGQGAAANAQTVIEAMESALGPNHTATDPLSTVLVGHSAGGLTAPLVARQYPVLHMVFLAAVLPRPAMSLEQQFRSEPGAEVDGFTWLTRNDGLLEMTNDVARRHFFHDCPPDVAEAAVGRLRLQTPTTLEEKSPLEVWPDVTSDYVVCERDRVLAPGWQRRLAIERLGVTPASLDAGHSPALACPQPLADLLQALAVGRSDKLTTG
ncbi:alpha/beta hydrolase [Mycobacterium sp. 21AC1]|uniref:alpha/beta hydrolase n=1 Tax=[Mycobacterium] appelbergii TaxID=2939269 RepID=UPI002938F03A|nr:alpha/beta hydrolase [Mycobacterium sp. 21AC1]MDV3127318.1 alpha/beta hydrolase [Mycobacterium sp. 21AC1]